MTNPGSRSHPGVSATTWRLNARGPVVTAALGS